MEAILIFIVLALLPKTISFPQNRSKAEINHALSSADEINALYIGNQMNTAVELANISSTLRIVAEKIDLLASKQLNSTQQLLPKPEEATPFRPAKLQFDTSSGQNAAVVEIPARKREKLGPVRFPRVSVPIAPSTINSASESTRMETPTQPMITVRDTKHSPDSRLAGSNAIGLISGTY